MIVIVDYDAGNLKSVEKAFLHLGKAVTVTSEAEVIRSAERVVLPGVGAFRDAMRNLKARGLDAVMKDVIAKGTPVLGVCLGMQMMYESSEEGGGCEGLGILKGSIVRFPDDMGLKVPQIGWNRLKVKRPSRLLAGTGENPYVYFVHSYYVRAQETETVTAVTQYGVEPHVVVEKENLFLTQFHPEKSGETGLKMLANFAAVRA